MVAVAKAHCQYMVASGSEALLVRLNAGASPVQMDDAGRPWRVVAGWPSRRLPVDGWSILEST
jgi:hypothetical protein